MRLRPSSTCLFDVANTLAFVLISADRRQITEFSPYPGVRDGLRELKENGVQVCAVFHCGEVPEEEVRTALVTADLANFIDHLLVVSDRVPSPEVFQQAAAFAPVVKGSEAASLLYIGGDEFARGAARDEGFLAVPHPALASGMLGNGGPLRYVRIRVPGVKYGRDWVPALRAQRVVPLHVSEDPLEGAATIYAIVDTLTAAALDDLGFWVDRLGASDEPQTTSLYLIRDDLQLRHGFLAPGGNASAILARGPDASRVLASTHEGILVAVSGGTPIESFHLIGSHDSHARKLLPSLNLFQSGSTVAARASTLLHAAVAAPLSAREREILCHHFTPEFMTATVATYAGTVAAATESICSRHVKHEGNHLAVEALVDDFEKIAPGRITVARHCFTHDGAQLTNVIATLPTAGMKGQGVVVISAHLDSTANGDGDNYDPARDCAPGADDDASGMAAVLAAAQAFAEISSSGVPHREVRFALFNCEEIDKSGSATYTLGLGASRVEIAAAFHIDMIGYHQATPGAFEVHAGFYAPEAPNSMEARARSADQALLIEHLRPIVTTLRAAEISTTLEDPGLGRSDHSMFHRSGYPACWIAEDFFPEDGPLSNLNPNYHKSGDTVIMADYAAQVGRLVGAAAWIAATR